MYALTMLKEYLDEILDGLKTFDARLFPTLKRGLILLVDSKTMKAYGTVELVGCKNITKDEFLAWHATGKFKNYVFDLKKGNQQYYAYDFINPHRLAFPIKIEEKKKTWVKLNLKNELVYQETLF